jgi:hypothetical protein
VNPHAFKEEKAFELVLNHSQISKFFPLLPEHQKPVPAANMPARRHFFRSPSPELPTLQQATIGTSVHTRLHVQPIRPGPTPKPVEKRLQFEPAGVRRLMGSPNDISVTEMFRSYQHDFRLQNPNIIEDNDNETFHRCSYTWEHKLAAVDMATNTWQRCSNRTLEHVSRYYVAKRLRVHMTVLGRWIKTKNRILALKKGAQRLRLSKVRRHPELKKKLNVDFKAARSIRRQITHRWFLR